MNNSSGIVLLIILKSTHHPKNKKPPSGYETDDVVTISGLTENYDHSTTNQT